jgi:hypothetical protein
MLWSAVTSRTARGAQAFRRWASRAEKAGHLLPCRTQADNSGRPVPTGRARASAPGVPAEPHARSRGRLGAKRAVLTRGEDLCCH